MAAQTINFDTRTLAKIGVLAELNNSIYRLNCQIFDTEKDLAKLKAALTEMKEFYYCNLAKGERF